MISRVPVYESQVRALAGARCMSSCRQAASEWAKSDMPVAVPTFQTRQL